MNSFYSIEEGIQSFSIQSYYHAGYYLKASKSFCVVLCKVKGSYVDIDNADMNIYINRTSNYDVNKRIIIALSILLTTPLTIRITMWT